MIAVVNSYFFELNSVKYQIELTIENFRGTTIGMDNNKMEGIFDKIYTPKQIAARGIISLVTQWRERERGRLNFFQIGRKILYSEIHIEDFLALCEKDGRNKNKKGGHDNADR